MIYARLYGGMGNQMYQYAFCKRLQIIYDQDICFDVSVGTEYAATETDKHKPTVLKEFSIASDKIHFIGNKKRFNKLAGPRMIMADGLDLFPRAFRKITKSNMIYRKMVCGIQKIFNRFGFYTAYDCLSFPIFNPKVKNIYVNGLFSCKEYFDDIYDSLINDFSPSHEPNEKNKYFLYQMKKTNSVCVHVRKGSSYVKNNYLNVCSGQYFSNSINTIEEKIDHPVFFIFSNDFEWCRENISMENHNCVLVDANDSEHAVDELALMQNCKHYILSNSTMGWWAQYLNYSPFKIVVSPSMWAKGKIKLLSDLIEDKWIKIEV